MFVGFIAVVVILLVIVGLMASGATNGSGGVDQTKATKALSEVSALAQSAGFYKTTTTNSDYSGLTTAALVTAGIINSADANAVGATGYNITVTKDAAVTAPLATDSVVKSKAVSGVYYNITANGLNNFNIDVINDGSLTSGLKAALEDALSKKFGTSATATNTTAGDGSLHIVF